MMHTVRIGFFLGAAFFLMHQAAGEQLVPSTEWQGCVPSNETASGLSCPAPTGLENKLSRRKASVTGGLFFYLGK